MSADIQNAYLQAPISEKYWTICGPEFDPELQGCKANIVRAIYGTQCARRDFRNHLCACMEMLNYKSCLADPDLWMREAKHLNGGNYYEYVLLYTDDALVVSEQPKHVYWRQINIQVQLPNGVIAYALSISQYVQEAIKNIEKTIENSGLALNKK